VIECKRIYGTGYQSVRILVAGSKPCLPEVAMARTWAVSFGENDRIELERIITDEDEPSALEFLKRVVYPKVKEAEKPGSCFREVTRPVDEVGRPIKKLKGSGGKP